MIKILIVEDDPAIAEIHRRFVQRLAGFEVLGVALTLFDAREQIGILKPDLVLLDVWLPDGEGFSLLRELRQAGASLDVILLTAAREAAALQEAMRLGVVDFILKPVVFERLRDTLEKYRQSIAALAALAGLPQALGLVQVDVAVNGGGDPAISVQRRLAGARREELRVRPPAVVSVEGAVARLRRAPLSGTLAGGAAAVETLTVPADVFAAVPPRGMGEVGPAVPRTKVMPSPVGDAALARLEQLPDTQSVAAPAQALVVSPEEAARHLLEAWAASGGPVPEGVVGDGVVADGVVGGATSENTASDGPEGR